MKFNNQNLDGDVLIFIHGRKANPSDLCIVQTPHGVTAKNIHTSDGDVVLKSANPIVPDQVWPCGDVKIVGVVKRAERDL